ncbi:hypothetical protein GCM10009745_79300 [Kribbella yunnanensis]|uniref:Uncharacterized protein n=1 Tax=Kribbella yunnanensis TaxID=190194 RepID=A0ABP4V8G8_9ACTN
MGLDQLVDGCSQVGGSVAGDPTPALVLGATHFIQPLRTHRYVGRFGQARCADGSRWTQLGQAVQANTAYFVELLARGNRPRPGKPSSGFTCAFEAGRVRRHLAKRGNQSGRRIRYVAQPDPPRLSCDREPAGDLDQSPALIQFLQQGKVFR